VSVGADYGLVYVAERKHQGLDAPMGMRLRLKRASAVPARSGRKPAAWSLDPQGT